MTDMNDFDALAAAAEAAIQDAEQFQTKSSFGKLSITPRYVQWVDGQPVEKNVKEYMELKTGERSLELTFSVNIQEFNTDLEWKYERKVNVGSTDWWKIFKPSLEAIEGFKDGLSKGKMSETLGKLHGAYVLAHDVFQSPTKKDPNPEYRTIKLVEVYPDRETCYAAWKVVFGANANSGGKSGNYPPGWDDSWDEMANDFAEKLAALVGATPAKRTKGIGTLSTDFAIDDKDWIKAELAKLEEPVAE